MDYSLYRIFILDDEEVFSFSMEHYLKKAGFLDIHRFLTSKALFEKMDKAPDVLILDHFLQNEIGLDVLERINESHPQIKVIYLSSQKTASIAAHALKLGAFAYQEKSVMDIEKVVELIISKENAEFTTIKK